MSSPLDREWAVFLRDGVLPSDERSPAASESAERQAPCRHDAAAADAEIPKLTISTQSNNAKLNSTTDIDVWAMFWALPVMPYVEQQEGVIKKQIKVQCANPAELTALRSRLVGVRSCSFSKEEHIDDPEGTTPFRYVSKLSIGLASKEVKAHRAREKNAFFNSFTMVLRVRYQGKFKEIVIKVFNKNVLSLPGMLDEELRSSTLALIDRVLGDTSRMLAPTKPPLVHLPGTITGVMVNSNFRCGFGLDRDKVVNLARDQCGLETTYDPSNYPGVICRYYQPAGVDTKGRCPCNPPCSTLRIGDKRSAATTVPAPKCQKLTFMVFRTGSVLIVGRCHHTLLHHVHGFVARMLLSNRACLESGTGERPNKTNVQKKSRKRSAWIHAEGHVTP